MGNSTLVPIAQLENIEEESNQSQRSIPLADGPPIEGGGQRKTETGNNFTRLFESAKASGDEELLYVALVNDNPAKQPIISAEDITTTVDIDLNSVQLDIPIEMAGEQQGAGARLAAATADRRQSVPN
jgi:hypothetical protein